MSKELEQAIAYLDGLEYDLPKNVTGSPEGIARVKYKKEAYLFLRKLLTPPTKEEVCKALSDFLKREVFFEDGCFLYHWNFNGEDVLACIVKYDYWLGFVIFYKWNLPSHIITMIGRFFEGESNVNNAED